MMQVIANLYSAHMDPDDWQQPQQFRPECFLDESGNVIGKDRVIPFSLGKQSFIYGSSLILFNYEQDFAEICFDLDGELYILILLTTLIMTFAMMHEMITCKH